jgi:hypothetical protein
VVSTSHPCGSVLIGIVNSSVGFFLRKPQVESEFAHDNVLCQAYKTLFPFMQSMRHKG